MKKLFRCFLALLPFFLLPGCEEMQVFPGGKEECLAETKSIVPDYYYWYCEKRIPLTVDENYVNIVLDSSFNIESDFVSFCDGFDLEAKTKVDASGLFKAKLRRRGDYHRVVSALRDDSRVLHVLPFFERGNGSESIGTSQFFYVQLKELLSDSLGTQERTPYIMFDDVALQEEVKKTGIRIVKEVAYMPGWFLLSIDGSTFNTSIDAANSLYESGRFEAIDPAFMFDFNPKTVNDPMFGQQWGLKNLSNYGYDINVEDAWTITTGTGVKIAIVDQGPDPNHLDLVSNYDCVSYDAENQSIPSAYDPNRIHGTHVSGIAAAKGNNGLQIAGVAYDAKIIRVSHNLSINPTVSAELASGISWAWQNGADVINNSWGDQGGYFYSYIHSSLLETSIINAMLYGRSGKGTVVVFAAGNSGNNGAIMDYPATMDDRILTVGSINSAGYRSFFSGYGSKLDVVAPGENVLSTLPGNSLGTLSGTSMAAPHVTGVVALMLAVNPDLKREEVVRFIELTAKRISPNGAYYFYSYQNRLNGKWNQEVGYGLIDAAVAVSLSQHSGGTPGSGNPSLSYYVVSEVAAQYPDSIVMGDFPVATVHFSVPSSFTNSSYTYCWHFTTSGDPSWFPAYYYVGNSPGVEMIIQRPEVDSVLSMRCEVYDGSTYLCSAYLDLGVCVSFP